MLVSHVSRSRWILPVRLAFLAVRFMPTHPLASMVLISQRLRSRLPGSLPRGIPRCRIKLPTRLVSRLRMRHSRTYSEDATSASFINATKRSMKLRACCVRAAFFVYPLSTTQHPLRPLYLSGSAQQSGSLLIRGATTGSGVISSEQSSNLSQSENLPSLCRATGDSDGQLPRRFAPLQLSVRVPTKTWGWPMRGCLKFGVR